MTTEIKRVCFEHEKEVYVVDVPHTHDYFNVVGNSERMNHIQKLTEKGREYCKEKISQR